MKKSKDNMPWKDAIVKVLKDYPEGLHYSLITEEILNQQLRKEIGATPANTVNVYINADIKESGEQSTFIKTDKGSFALRERSGQDLLIDANSDQVSDAPMDSTGESVIKAYGMFWLRRNVDWNPSKPRLLGVQMRGADPVDFSDQSGLYLLYDAREVVYVGRTTKDRLGMRLLNHTDGRLANRWDRFSWFGFNGVQSQDATANSISPVVYSQEQVINAMEAILIEGLEPRQNRRRGDGYSATEFLQVIDPEIEARLRKKHLKDLIESVR